MRTCKTSALAIFGQSAAVSEIEKIFKFLVQRNAQDQRKLCGGIELAGFNGTDGIA